MNGLKIQWGRKATQQNYNWHNETITGLLFSTINYCMFFTSEEPTGNYDGIFFIWITHRTQKTCEVIVNPYNSAQRLNYFYWFAIGY